MPFYAVTGPRDAGPGEREQMLDRAHGIFDERSIDDPVRIDVPGRGADEDGDGSLRDAVQPIVPALQSGSLFGGGGGVLVVDAQSLLKAEADVITELLTSSDQELVTAVFVAAGSVPASVAKVIKSSGETISVRKLRERDASTWLATAAKERNLRLEPEAVTILLHHFGSNVAALGQVLDQLALEGGMVTAEVVRGRYSNRPDAPMWHYADAISSGQEGEALRRLEDFLEHNHPLVLLAFLEGEVRRRSLAAAAPDLETYASWVGSSPSAYPVRKVWDGRSRTKAASLRRSLDAVARVDLTLKTAPEATHRVTLERLTVALCRWLGR